MCPIKILVPTLATALLCSAAQASIVYFPSEDIPIPTNFAGVSVDLETGATSNDLEGFAAGDANFYYGGAEITNDAYDLGSSPSWQPVRTGTGNTDPAANLVVNVNTVESGSTFSTGYGSSGDISTHFPPFTSGTPGYIGFSLITGPTTVYGWMRVTLQDDNTPGVIHEWAYEDTGAAILVGAIPEPGTGALALLGLGAFALRRRRR